MPEIPSQVIPPVAVPPPQTEGQIVPADVLSATVQALAKTVAGIGKVELAKVMPFAEQYGPAAARWGVRIAVAKSSNADPLLINRYERKLRMLAEAAQLELEDAGILAQGAGEQSVLSLLQFAAHFAVASI